MVKEPPITAETMAETTAETSLKTGHFYDLFRLKTTAENTAEN